MQEPSETVEFEDPRDDADIEAMLADAAAEEAVLELIHADAIEADCRDPRSKDVQKKLDKYMRAAARAAADDARQIEG